MNVRLLRRIQRVILEEPKRHDMNIWATDTDRFLKGYHKMPSCNTVGCIYGWAKALSTNTRAVDLVHLMAMGWNEKLDDGAEILGISADQAKRLFLASEWPDEFRENENKLRKGSALYVANTNARISHFIATKGAE